MADSELVLNDVLCYILTKFRKYRTVLLKRVVIEFFSVNAISEAKNRLVDDVLLMDIPESLPIVNYANDVAVQYIDHIFDLLTFLDEKSQLNRLPKYVTDNVDRLPSADLSEGDMKFIFDIIKRTDTKIDALSGTVNTMAADINGLKGVYASVQSSQSSSLPKQSDVINIVTRPAARAPPSTVSDRQPTDLAGLKSL